MEKHVWSSDKRLFSKLLSSLEFSVYNNYIYGNMLEEENSSSFFTNVTEVVYLYVKSLYETSTNETFAQEAVLHKMSTVSVSFQVPS